MSFMLIIKGNSLLYIKLYYLNSKKLNTKTAGQTLLPKFQKN